MVCLPVLDWTVWNCPHMAIFTYIINNFICSSLIFTNTFTTVFSFLCEKVAFIRMRSNIWVHWVFWTAGSIYCVVHLYRISNHFPWGGWYPSYFMMHKSWWSLSLFSNNSEISFLSLFFLLGGEGGGTGGWTLSFKLAKQVLYHLSHSTNPLNF
jgi:hypothetical protein